MRKKGLEIGVNAIVVLVFAVTVLGLGLAFIRGSFGSLTGGFDQVSNTIKDQITDDLRNSNARLAFDVAELNLKRGDSKDVYFGVKNELDADATFAIVGSGSLDSAGLWVVKDSVISCFDAIDADAKAAASRVIQFSTFSTRAISKGDVNVLKLVVKASSAAKPTTYSCAMVIKDPRAGVAAGEEQYARKDFFVTVA